METKTGLTPEQKQRILTATGHVFTGHSGEFYHVSLEAALSVKDFQNIRSWEPDANWCEGTLKAFVRELPYVEQANFGKYLIEIYGKAERVSGLSWLDEWISLTPELLCTAFDTFLLERDGNK